MDDVLAFVGIGRMGQAMAGRLLEAGYPLRVWDRTPARAQTLPGALVCPTAREAAQDATLVFSSLADDRAVRAVTLGEQGILAGLGEGAIHIGTSTISLSLCGELLKAHAAAGRTFVAAPVLGRPDAAAKGKLWILAGGDPGAIARCRPVFEHLGQGTIPFDSAPHASLAKLIVNLTMAGTIELLGEATALAQKGGIAPMMMIRVLSDTLFGSPVVRGYGPRIAADRYEPAAFRIDLGLKDVLLALAAGADLRVPLPVANVARDHLLEALARGQDDLDWTGLAGVARDAAGIDATPHH